MPETYVLGSARVESGENSRSEKKKAEQRTALRAGKTKKDEVVVTASVVRRARRDALGRGLGREFGRELAGAPVGRVFADVVDQEAVIRAGFDSSVIDAF